MPQGGSLCQGASKKYDGKGIKRSGKKYLLTDLKNSGFWDVYAESRLIALMRLTNELYHYII